MENPTIWYGITDDVPKLRQAALDEIARLEAEPDGDGERRRIDDHAGKSQGPRLAVAAAAGDSLEDANGEQIA